MWFCVVVGFFFFFFGFSSNFVRTHLRKKDRKKVRNWMSFPLFFLFLVFKHYGMHYSFALCTHTHARHTMSCLCKICKIYFGSSLVSFLLLLSNNVVIMVSTLSPVLRSYSRRSRSTSRRCCDTSNCFCCNCTN